MIEDPDAERLAGDLAAAMDARVSLLGNQVAADRPVWALRYLGEVPACLIQRAEWIRRAGAAAAYREERGYADEVEAIGPAPGRGSPEQRASWQAAYVALRMPAQDREAAAATDGELWARRAAYARETAWAPPYVAGEARDAHIAEDSYRADAVHAWYRADIAADKAAREKARQGAEQFSALAQEVGSYREKLTQITDARRAWNAATEASRQRALMADTELRRRHLHVELPPLHSPEEARGSGTVPETVDPDVEVRQPEPSVAADRAAHVEAGPEPGFTADRTEAARLDIKMALEAARRARRPARHCRRVAPSRRASRQDPGRPASWRRCQGPPF